MEKELTLSIIKPDIVAKGQIGEVLSRLEHGGLRVVALKMVKLSREQAEDFYAVHRHRPFYPELVSFMCSNPIVVQILSGYDAVAQYRKLMGATDPQQAAPGTIRADLGESILHNAVHGSDALETARFEIACFFAPGDINHFH